MKYFLLIVFLFTLHFSLLAQERFEDRDKGLDKTTGILDRAGGTHNASAIGLFFENRGKLYPRRVTQGPSGEFPINSGKNYIYRIAPMVGVPGNVVQGRYTTNEEWEAAYGFHNRELSQIAFSDKPNTWNPENGWPVKDSDGNPVIKSDQDSYAVYNDSNNTVQILDIEVHQIGYAYGVSFAQDMIFYTYKVVNKSNKNYDDFYFGLYADIDVGNISGGDPEYGDDFVGFDKEKNFLYFYDDGVSDEWEGGTTGYFGVAFLKTPQTVNSKSGITDFHYNLYFDDEDRDSIQYGILSSSPDLYNSNSGGRYFHLGNNAALNFDDPSTIPSSGLDIVANVGSGPYTINSGDTLVFVTAIVAGDNYNDVIKNVETAERIMEFDFEISKPPATPNLTGVSGDNKNILFWDDKAELSRDNFSGEYDFDGYRLYRSIDKGVNWSLVSDYNIASSSGLQYSFVDTNVTNGFEYWYSVTAYDRGDTSIVSLESPKGSSPDSPNLVSLKPLSNPAGYMPVSAADVNQVGNGNSNYQLLVSPVDKEELSGASYKVGFTYITRIENGNLDVTAESLITDSSQVNMHDYAFVFISENQYELVDLTTDEVVEPTPRRYISGRTYEINSSLEVKLTNQSEIENFSPPQKDDRITVRFAVAAVRNNKDTVITPRPFKIGQLQSTEDGVLFQIKEPDIIDDVSRIGGTDNLDISFSVDDETVISDETYTISTTGNGTGSDGESFISLIIKDGMQNTISAYDTLYNFSAFQFGGISGIVEFDPENPPAAGNNFSLTTIKPKALTPNDVFEFEINPSSIDNQIVRENISNIRVVPNPYVVSSLYEPEFGELRREPLREIQFINLPVECTIHIYTIDADLVKTLRNESNSGTVIWDLRSEGGREIAPGIYIYVVKSDDAEYLSRFAVIK